MLPTSWLRSLRARSHSSRKTSSHRRNSKAGSAIHSLERLEDRLALSGFGSGDGAYVLEPWSGSYSAVKIQPTDQKIVAAGSMYISNPNNTTEDRMAIARYDSLGNTDSAFGSGGVSAPALGPSNEFGDALVLQPDGKAVVSGQNTSPSSLAVARFTTSGALDSSFGNGGWNTLAARSDFAEPAQGVGLQFSGKIVVDGWSSAIIPINGINTSAVAARFTASGAIDSGKAGFGQVVQGKATGYSLNTFGAVQNYFRNLAVQPDDKVVAVGYEYDNVNYPRLLVARYTADGKLDTSFNSSGYTVLAPTGISTLNSNGVALQSDGRIVVVGTSSGVDGANDMFVARYNANGTLDSTFGGGVGYVRVDVDGTASVTAESGLAVVIQTDGKIVAVGREASTVAGSAGSVMVARLNPDGSLDSGFGNGGIKLGSAQSQSGFNNFVGDAVALQSDGTIIVAGTDNPQLLNSQPLLMRFSGASNTIGSAPATSTSTNSTAAATDAALLLVLADNEPTITSGGVTTSIASPADDPLAAS